MNWYNNLPGRRFLCNRHPGQTKQAISTSNVIPAATPKVIASTSSSLPIVSHQNRRNHLEMRLLINERGKRGPNKKVKIINIYVRIFRGRRWSCGDFQFSRTTVFVVCCSAAQAGSWDVEPRARESGIPLSKLIDVARTVFRVQHWFIYEHG